MLITILVCSVLIFLDQWTKFLAANYLQPVQAVTVIPGVLELRYFENTGAAFSLLSGKQILLVGFTGLVLLAGAYILLFKRPKDKLVYVGILLAFSGGMGNFIDRLFNGYVIDFFNFLFINFAVFNVADIFITAGFSLLIFAILREEVRAKKAKENPPAPSQDQEMETGDHKDGKT